jgi:hypothetical protein
MCQTAKLADGSEKLLPEQVVNVYLRNCSKVISLAIEVFLSGNVIGTALNYKAAG